MDNPILADEAASEPEHGSVLLDAGAGEFDAGGNDQSKAPCLEGEDKGKSPPAGSGKFIGPVAALAGCAIALLQFGFSLTGTTANVWLDAAVPTVGFSLIGYGLWTWGRSLNWNIGFRIGAVCLSCVVCLALAAPQIERDVANEHPSPQPSTPSGPQTATGSPAAQSQQATDAGTPAAPDQSQPPAPATAPVKRSRLPVATQKGPCNLAKSGGFAKPVSPGCGPIPMTMSNANYSRYAASFGSRANAGFVVLLATYREDAFELSKQLCAPAKSLHWASACPRVSGPSVVPSGFQNLEVDAERLSQVCLASRGGVVTSSLAYRNCSNLFFFTSFPPNDSDYHSPVAGLFCYYDAWESREGISFKNALSQAGLPCTFVGHEYHTSNERLFTNGDGEEIGSITVVIGDAVQRQ